METLLISPPSKANLRSEAPSAPLHKHWGDSQVLCFVQASRSMIFNQILTLGTVVWPAFLWIHTPDLPPGTFSVQVSRHQHFRHRRDQTTSGFTILQKDVPLDRLRFIIVAMTLLKVTPEAIPPLFRLKKITGSNIAPYAW